MSEPQWSKVDGLLPARADTVGVPAKTKRTFINGVLWVLRSGAHRKHMPTEYGNWKSAHKRFTRWAKAGIWERIFKVLLADRKNTWVMIDSTIVRAHQQAVCGAESW